MSNSRQNPVSENNSKGEEPFRSPFIIALCATQAPQPSRIDWLRRRKSAGPFFRVALRGGAASIP
jgi:hypothetical protein